MCDLCLSDWHTSFYLQPVTINNAFEEEMERQQDFRDFEEIGIHRDEARDRSKSATPTRSKKRTEGPKRAAKETSPLASVSSPQKRPRTSQDDDAEDWYVDAKMPRPRRWTKAHHLVNFNDSLIDIEPVTNSSQLHSRFQWHFNYPPL